MISIPVASDCTDLTVLQSVSRGLPRAYAILFFSPDRRLGWALLTISLFAPDVGLCGVAGVLAAAALATSLGFDRARIQNGYYLFNPLLVCLTIGWMNRAYGFPWPTFLTLWAGAVLGGFFMAVALQQWFGQQLALSPQSLPATAVSYFLYFLAVVAAGRATGLHPGHANRWLDLPLLPMSLRAFFQTLGSMLFEPRVLPGMMVGIALLAASPFSLLIAASSFAVGLATMTLLGFAPTPEGVIWCGFNFLLCGIALGSAYFAPSRASLLLAWVGTFLCALMALALSSVLGRFGLPASALPYNLVVLTVVYALRQRVSAAGLHPSPFPGTLPEKAGRLVVISANRFPHLHLPALMLPLAKECIVTQGFDGPLTHRPPWNHALDLEMLSDGRRWTMSGERLEEYPIFNQPVLAPCDGTIVGLVSHVHDNAPGSNNFEQNWGNHLVVLADAGYHVLLAHLRQRSMLVVVGQRVLCGQSLGHCGNSGRSPVPHLHVQVQTAAHAGAATRPFCLRHYFEASSSSSSLRYFTSGTPQESSRVIPAVPWPELHGLFSNWLPGEYRYRVTRLGIGGREEIVSLDFDEAGRFRLRSHSHRAILFAFFSNGVFFTTDYDGPGESVLAFLAIGLARVPCVRAAEMAWGDIASGVPFQRRLVRRMHELADPFLGPSLLKYEYFLQPSGDRIQLQACLNPGISQKAPAAAVLSMTTRLVPRFGVDQIEAKLVDGEFLTIKLMEHSAQGTTEFISRLPTEVSVCRPALQS